MPYQTAIVEEEGDPYLNAVLTPTDCSNHSGHSVASGGKESGLSNNKQDNFELCRMVFGVWVLNYLFPSSL